MNSRFLRGPEVHQRNSWILSISSWRTSRTRHVPDFSNHSLFLNTLLNSSYLEGNSGRNKQLNGTISLSTHTQVESTFCPSISKRAFARVFTDFALQRENSPPFGCSHKSHSNDFQNHGMYADTCAHTCTHIYKFKYIYKKKNM